MTIIRIQIDEKHDTIGLSIQKCHNSTKREATLAKSVAEVAKAAISTALDKSMKEKAAETAKEKEKENVESK